AVERQAGDLPRKLPEEPQRRLLPPHRMVLCIRSPERGKRRGHCYRRHDACRRRARLPSASRPPRLPPRQRDVSAHSPLPSSRGYARMSVNLKRVPCTVVTGFLGAGKTTLIRHLIENLDGKRVAIIVN